MSVERITAGYGRLRVMQDVSLNIRSGEFVCVIGPNGAGKTTLLHSICGTVPIESGAIRFVGKPIHRLDPIGIVGRGVALVPENRRIFGPLTVSENLMMGAYLRHQKGDQAAIRKDLEDLYETFPILKSRQTQLAGLLSGGEQQMLAIGRALMSRPQLLLLDEPSMGLAPLIVKDIFRVLSKLRGRTTLLLVEQNARLALQISDRGYILERGRVVAQGSREELQQDATIMKTYLGK